MNAKVIPFSGKKAPLSSDKIKEKIRTECEVIISFCTQEHEGATFFEIEKEIWKSLSNMGVLCFQLFLMSSHERLNYDKWLSTGLYYARLAPTAKTIKTVFGKVNYYRTYLIRKDSRRGGFYPLDIHLGLTRDGFSPSIISLATRLSTRVSFLTSVKIFGYFYEWSPSTESVESLVLGLGREASNYMEVAEAPENDGEVLIIEADGKATPTATEEELEKRRQKRGKQKKGCCQQHRGKQKRKGKKRKRRKKGDKSKNGRSITIVVMYTLKRGADGRSHGPINKIVWASYAPRSVIFDWARRQATKRGFPPGTKKRIHIATDGERCLKKGLEKLFPEATFALDIIHVEEKLWKIGRAYYGEGSEEAEEWADAMKTSLYEGRVMELLSLLEEMLKQLSKRAKRDKSKRETLSAVITYLKPRLDMMNYKDCLEEDLPIASGIVEGAARYVVGERTDCSGMRWIPERAEALLHLRCVELNGDWDRFFEWTYNGWIDKLRNEDKVQVRTNESVELPKAA